MNFVQFAAMHGVIINRLTEGRWCRVPTSDKPTHRNGAYKLTGSIGWVQNWATMVEPSVWRDESCTAESYKAQQQIIRKAAQDTAKMAQDAARKAQWILSQCELKPHPYLVAKGFADEMVQVWDKDGAELMVVPMRTEGRIIGCQLIGADGAKKFLTGQRTGGASFVFDGKGPNVLCEGFATALSARHALKNIKARYTLHVCFSAGNMARIASTLGAGFVVADNDASGTGERVAREIGWPYWISDVTGEDADDYRQRKGLFSLANGLRLAMRGNAMA
jgi:phage/plasmid primase-like uncharacterized protein